MLEAKDTSASALQKKGLHKNCLAISRKKRFPKNFSAASQNFKNSKNSAVLEPRTGQFSRTWGFEAKAKNLTFKVKAKDFKMCLRDQGRPRGLHLWFRCAWDVRGFRCTWDPKFLPPPVMLSWRRACIHPLINTIFRASYCPTWHYQVWHVLSFSNISRPVLLKFNMSSWSTSYSRFKIFKRLFWHGLLNAAHQILLSMFDLYWPIQ